MLTWNSKETRDIREAVFAKMDIKKHAPSHYGRLFFYSTIFLTMFSELLLSYLFSIRNYYGVATLVFLLGFVLLRYQFILHEASHGVLVANRKENEFYGYTAGYVVGYPLRTYRINHGRHHVHTATKKDFELDNFIDRNHKWSVKRQFLSKILKALFLVDFLILLNTIFLVTKINDKSNGKGNNIILLIISGFSQLLLLTYFVDKNVLDIAQVIFLYILAIGSVTFFLNRIRGVCEHSLYEELRYYNYTRSHVKNYFTFLLAPINFCFHLEHHLFPEISSYHYGKINNFLREKFTNKNWLSQSYIKTIFGFIKVESK